MIFLQTKSRHRFWGTFSERSFEHTIRGVERQFRSDAVNFDVSMIIVRMWYPYARLSAFRPCGIMHHERHWICTIQSTWRMQQWMFRAKIRSVSQIISLRWWWYRIRIRRRFIRRTLIQSKTKWCDSVASAYVRVNHDRAAYSRLHIQLQMKQCRSTGSVTEGSSKETFQGSKTRSFCTNRIVVSHVRWPN
jgi:hypothetical protein